MQWNPRSLQQAFAVSLIFASFGGCPSQDAGQNSDNGSDGSNGTAGTAGAAGALGAPGPQGTPGPIGPAGPIDTTAPAAPTSLWITNSPLAIPPNYELRWIPGASTPPIQYFKIYQSPDVINSADDTLLSGVVPGPSDRAVLPIFVGSGIRHFRVAAVSYTGVEGPLSPEFAVDTTARVAFGSDRAIDEQFNLYVGAPGAAPTSVSGTLVTGGNASNGIWSPTARHLAFVADADTDEVQELYVAPADGSAARLKISGALVAGGEVENFGYAWSPDATRLIYRADQITDDVTELFVTRADGSAAPVALSGPLVAGGDVTGTTEWSPDGTRIVFAADKDLDGTSSLYVVVADGSAPPVRVSAPPVAGVSAFPYVDLWSPDSTRILFTVHDSIAATNDVLVASADGSGAISLTGAFPTMAGTAIWWSPDGTRVAFIADYETLGIAELFVVPADGSGPPVRVSGALVANGAVSAGIFHPWSPDGTRLIFLADKLVDGQSQLFVTDAGGSEPVLISDPAFGSIHSAQWSPDGEHVAYFRGNEIRITDGRTTDFVGIVGALTPNGSLWGPCCYEWNASGSGMYFMADKLVDERLEIFLAGLTDDNEPEPVSGASPPAASDSFSGTGDASPIGVRRQ